MVAALWFLSSYAFPYLTMDPDRMGIYWPRRDWLLVHIAGGMVALLIGPIQLWLGATGSARRLHRILGIGYVMGVASSSVAAFYLAFHSDFGWIFGTGLTMLAVAWIVTTSLAVAAICRCVVQQHREWMIRSYVVTFAFVVFRVFVGILEMAGVGTAVEQLTAASWFCWSVPLLITETVLQGRKIFATRAHSKPRPHQSEHGMDVAV
jgi:uncharacterized membrane protein